MYPHAPPCILTEGRKRTDNWKICISKYSIMILIYINILTITSVRLLLPAFFLFLTTILKKGHESSHSKKNHAMIHKKIWNDFLKSQFHIFFKIKTQNLHDQSIKCYSGFHLMCLSYLDLQYLLEYDFSRK